MAVDKSVDDRRLYWRVAAEASPPNLPFSNLFVS